MGTGFGPGVGASVLTPGTGAGVGAGVVHCGFWQQGFNGSYTIVQYVGRPGYLGQLLEQVENG